METYEGFVEAYKGALRELWMTPEYVSDNVGRVCVVIARIPNPAYHKLRAKISDMERTHPEWVKDYRDGLEAYISNAAAVACLEAHGYV